MGGWWFKVIFMSGQTYVMLCFGELWLGWGFDNKISLPIMLGCTVQIYSTQQTKLEMTTTVNIILRTGLNTHNMLKHTVSHKQVGYIYPVLTKGESKYYIIIFSVPPPFPLNKHGLRPLPPRMYV